MTSDRIGLNMTNIYDRPQYDNRSVSIQQENTP